MDHMPQLDDRILNDQSLDVIFRAARTHNRWLDRPVSEVTLRALYDLLRWGPTSANAQPARFVFVTSAEAREKLLACVSQGNQEKVRTAPVTAIVAYDTKFYEELPKLFPHNPAAKDWFASDAALVEETAFRNSSLQGAYLIIAARALGLDCGPMSGFDKAKLDAAFFPDGRYRSNFICALGYGDPAGLFPRNPRLSFAEACEIL